MFAEVAGTRNGGYSCDPQCEDAGAVVVWLWKACPIPAAQATAPCMTVPGAASDVTQTVCEVDASVQLLFSCWVSAC
jgi:hypothetical protein